MLFQDRATIGGFTKTGTDPTAWYWSSTEVGYVDDAWLLDFGNGAQHYRPQGYYAALRCVAG